MMKSILFALIALLTSAHANFSAGDKRAVIFEEKGIGTCTQNATCYNEVTDYLDTLWGGKRALRGGSEQDERALTACPPGVISKCREWDDQFFICLFFQGCTARRQLQGDFVSEQDEMEAALDDACWSDAGVGTDIAITKKVQRHLGAQYDVTNLSFRMQVYKCGGF